MRVFIFVSCIIFVNSATFSADPAKEFRDFELEYGKIYKNQAERTKRFNIFKNNLHSIKQHNTRYEQGLTSYIKGISQFSDMTREELRGSSPPKSIKKSKLNGRKFMRSGNKIPESIDWRDKGQVTEIRSQKKCHAGWDFGIIGSAEAAYFRKSGNLIELSKQHLLNCVTNYTDGCSGFLYSSIMGGLQNAFPYILENGLQSEENYPYTALNDGCLYNASNVLTHVNNFTIIGGNEDDLLDAVANIGPVATSLDASDLYYYKSGIYSCEYPFYTGHGVLIIGYGSENGTDYWIVKNSWGPNWGENGYFRILRGTNTCCISDGAIYPVIN